MQVGKSKNRYHDVGLLISAPRLTRARLTVAEVWTLTPPRNSRSTYATHEVYALLNETLKLEFQQLILPAIKALNAESTRG